MTASNEQTTDSVVLDFGRAKKKKVKRLRKGRGALFTDAHTCIEEMKRAGELSEGAFPVFVVVREKDNDRSLFF